MNDPVKKKYQIAFDKTEVPAHLLDRTLNAAFQSVQSEKKHFSGMFRLKPLIIAVLIAAVMLGTAVVYASISGLWSRGLSGTIHSDPDEQQKLVDQGFAFPLTEKYQDLAVTCSGVTITPNMILTDGMTAYISFLIEGYDYEIGKEERPVFSNNDKDSPLKYMRDGNDPDKYIYAARIYADGFYSDGSPAQINQDGSAAGRYRDENGNLEYIIKIMTTEGTLFYDDPYNMNPDLSGSLYGSVLHVEFRDLGTADPTFDRAKSTEFSINDGENNPELYLNGCKNIVYGTWTFDIRMPDEDEVSDMIRTVDINEQLQDTDCFIEIVKISPISVNLTYTVSQPKNKRGADNAFTLCGMRLKDGTIIKKSSFDLPVVLYGDSEVERSELITLDHVVDPEQVEALLVNLYGYSEEIEIPLK